MSIVEYFLFSFKHEGVIHAYFKPSVKLWLGDCWDDEIQRKDRALVGFVCPEAVNAKQLSYGIRFSSSLSHELPSQVRALKIDSKKGSLLSKSIISDRMRFFEVLNPFLSVSYN